MPQKGTKTLATGSYLSSRKVLRSLPAAPAPPVRDILRAADLPRTLTAYVQEGTYLRLSPRTREARLSNIGKLIWFLDNEGHARCGHTEILAFLTYLATGHQEKGGRWGKGGDGPQFSKPPALSTLKCFHTYLRAFFGWCVEQGMLDVHPMARIKPPRVPVIRQQPFSPDEIRALEDAAKKTTCSRRDTAILLLLWDTGLRLSEVAGLSLTDLDMVSNVVLPAETLHVRYGKGDKARVVSYGLGVSRALWAYLREERRDPTSVAALDLEEERGDSALFEMAVGHGRYGNVGLTAQGIWQMIERLGDMAGITRSRCPPHTFRNTFAVEALRSGMDVFTLKEILGHTSLAMTNRYVELARADIAASHRRHSPAERLARRNKM